MKTKKYIKGCSGYVKIEDHFDYIIERLSFHPGGR